MLHGWGQDTTSFQTLVSMLESEFQVTTFDFPGFGTGPAPGSHWGIQEYIEWTADKLSKHPPAILFGHSFGGRVAIGLAARQPAWLRSVILSGTPGLYRPSRKVRSKILLARIWKSLKLPNTNVLGSQELRDADQKGLASIFKKIVPVDQKQELTQIKIPTLLIRGEHDTAVTHATYQEMISAIPSHPTCITIPRIGHNIHLENPFILFGIIKKFSNAL
ncbi:MAG: alpha/beta hydrolase [Methylacidiphilales bacterium]|nr:alpha/beta hydrolase [Candidatus Methylacidiphilales bacterium]